MIVEEWNLSGKLYLSPIKSHVPEDTLEIRDIIPQSIGYARDLINEVASYLEKDPNFWENHPVQVIKYKGNFISLNDHKLVYLLKQGEKAANSQVYDMSTEDGIIDLASRNRNKLASIIESSFLKEEDEESDLSPHRIQMINDTLEPATIKNASKYHATPAIISTNLGFIMRNGCYHIEDILKNGHDDYQALSRFDLDKGGPNRMSGF